MIFSVEGTQGVNLLSIVLLEVVHTGTCTAYVRKYCPVHRVIVPDFGWHHAQQQIPTKGLSHMRWVAEQLPHNRSKRHLHCNYIIDSRFRFVGNHVKRIYRVIEHTHTYLSGGLNHSAVRYVPVTKHDYMYKYIV